ISYVGCGASSLFLCITLVTYLVLNNNEFEATVCIFALCITVAVLLHYFLLAAFTWMCLESVQFYLALVKVFNVYVPKYILKCSIASLVSLLTELLTEHVTSLPCSCWIQENTVFYISVVAYIVLIFLINTAMFITVLLQIHSMKSRTYKRSRFWKQSFLQDLKSAFSLMFLLGLAWGFAFFAWGAVRILFFYLFSIFNTLQGNICMEYCYKYNSLGPWVRNKYASSCSSSMGKMLYGFYVTVFSCCNGKASLQWDDNNV
uniref:Uncharacterized protein n=1 Tax=Melopsittacus undulatus TaxID=13146 RepID=A0A8C6JQ57_MELUD